MRAFQINCLAGFTPLALALVLCLGADVVQTRFDGWLGKSLVECNGSVPC